MIAFMPFIIGILLAGNSFFHPQSNSLYAGIFLIVVGVILHIYFSNEKALKQIYYDHYLNDLRR